MTFCYEFTDSCGILKFTPETHSSTLRENVDVNVDELQDPTAIGKLVAECHARHPTASTLIGNNPQHSLAVGAHLDRQQQALRTSQQQQRRPPVIVVEADPPPQLLLTPHAVQALASEAERQVAAATDTEVYEPETLYVEKQTNSERKHPGCPLLRASARRRQLAIMSTRRTVTGESDTEVDTNSDDSATTPPAAAKPADTPSARTPTPDSTSQVEQEAKTKEMKGIAKKGTDTGTQAEISSTHLNCGVWAEPRTKRATTSDTDSVAARFRTTLQRVPREHLTDVLHQVLEQAEQLVEKTKPNP